MKKEYNALLIDTEIKEFFNKLELTELYQKLNVIIKSATNFKDNELIFVAKSKVQGDISTSLNMFCIGLESKRQATVNLVFAKINNKMISILDQPILSVDEEIIDEIFQYRLSKDYLNLVEISKTNKSHLQSKSYQLKQKDIL